MATTGPDLNNPNLFVCRPGVPILDVHTRGARVVDAARLKLVAENSNRRASRGDPGLLFIGHTQDGVPETKQPPLAGYTRNYRLSQFNGKPCLTADLYYRKDRPEAFEYPRRSVEVFYSDQNPENNYIDSIALLKTSPERDLSLVTYSRKGLQKERYSLMPDMTASTSAGISEAEADALAAFMQQQQITDVSEGVRAYLQAKADGSLPDGVDFGQKDIAGLEKYAKAQGVDLRKPGVYEATLERYKADKRAGKLLHRT